MKLIIKSKHKNEQKQPLLLPWNIDSNIRMYHTLYCIFNIISILLAIFINDFSGNFPHHKV